MTEKTSWSLRRVGWTEPNFILHEHNKVISLGRACDVQKQCLGGCAGVRPNGNGEVPPYNDLLSGRHVSRRHCEFRQIKLEGKTYWTIKHLGGVSKTFLNRNAIPNNEEIRKCISCSGVFQWPKTGSAPVAVGVTCIVGN